MRFSLSLLFALSLSLALSLAPRPGAAGADLFALYDLAEADPTQAAPAIDAELAALQSAPNPDMRVFFDLALLRAEVAEAQQDWPHAAALYAQLAQVAAATPALDQDPVALWSRAADAAEQAGDLRSARAALRQKLSAVADRTPAPAVVADIYDALARTAEALGDEADAARNRAAAARPCARVGAIRIRPPARKSASASNAPAPSSQYRVGSR